MQLVQSLKKHGNKIGAAVGAMAGTGLAMAQAAEAVAAVEQAQADGLLVAGALVLMGVAIWGAMYLYRKFFR
jgi:hypothetical protein